MSTAYFTGKGDDGTTGILSAKRVSKSDVLMCAIGDIDELNSSIGVAMSYIEDPSVNASLKQIQNVLFVLGANLASANEKKMAEAQIKHEEVVGLEDAIREIDEQTPSLKSFVLPGGDIGASHLHMSRAIARRAERSVIAASKTYDVDKDVIAYLNRLSSYLFAAARFINNSKGVEETNPTY